MQKVDRMPKFDLQLFADGAAAGGEGTAPAAQQESGGALPKAGTNSRPGSSRRGRSGGEFANVVFGKQEDASAAEGQEGSVAGAQGEGNANKSGVETTSNTLEERRAKFQELIGGEYKDVYAEQFQQAFNRRFRETKELEEAVAAQKPVLDMLRQKYGVEDMEKLQKAIEEDDSYWSAAAEKAGLTVEQYRSIQKLERENQAFRQAQRQREGEEQAQRQLAQWYREAEGLKEKFPGFDLRTECQNREFIGLLKAGIGVETAYRTMHMDEITEAAARAAAQSASAQMEASIREKAARPPENGTSRQSAAIVKSDVHGLSRAERAEIARRAARGEKISF